MVNYVIVGNGVSGVRAAEIIRSHDPSGSMIMVSEEEYPFYYRPFLPEYVAGLVDEERLWAKPKDFYTHHKIQLKLGQRVRTIDTNKKLVLLENGDNIRYDTLLIATGGSPAPFHCPGWDAEGVLHLKTLSDAKRLREKIPAVTAGVIIGTGILGLEFIDTLIKCGLATHYVIPGDNIWPAVLDEKASALVENRLSKSGARIHKRAKIKQISTENNQVNGVRLATGETISCQLVGLAIGLQPNIELVRGSGVQTRGMIFVNRKMETNIPEIYAAGDVALCYEMPGEESRCLPRWHRAWKQGEVAGLNMVGKEADYQEIPICAASTKIAGIHLLCLGDPNPSEKPADVLLGVDEDQGIYKKIVLKNHHITGSLFIADIRGKEKITQFMERGTPITASERAVIQEIVKVEGGGPALPMTICPICKMELSQSSCPACTP